MNQGEQPLGPRRLDFSALSDDDFEELAYLVVLLDHEDAIRLRAPDLGADSALPLSDRTYARCWQAKRFTGSISWPQCKESLDRAVDHYKMPHYTFIFAKNLTGNQERLFRQHLVGRHTGVRVDWWGTSRIISALFESDQGQRIVKHFYGDAAQDMRALIRAVRAGGELATGADALARLGAVAEYLGESDPFFAYTTSTRPSELLIQIPTTPGAVMALEAVTPDSTIRIEALPRNRAALERLPQGTFSFEDTPEGQDQLAAFNRVLVSGGEATLDAVRLEFSQLPSVFEALAPPSEGLEVTVRGEKRLPAPWNSRIQVSSDRGQASIDIHLAPTSPTEDWDGALVGTVGCLTMTVLFRARQRGGEIQVTLNYQGTRTGLRGQADALAVIDAIHGVGTLTIEDRDGHRPPVVFNLAQRPIEEFLVRRRRLVEDLLLIGDWTQRTVELPEEVSSRDLRGIAEAAQIIRSGESRMAFSSSEIAVDPEQRAALGEGDFQLRMGMEFALALSPLGEVWPLGYLSGEVNAKVVEETPLQEDGRELVAIRLEPASEEARHPIFRLSREKPEPSKS
ncbi:MAG: hypothetical protein ABSC51_01225 [Gaiellaceae bacterium]|jgi:hypothetical protein